MGAAGSTPESLEGSDVATERVSAPSTTSAPRGASTSGRGRWGWDEVIGKHHRMFCDPSYVESEEYKQFWKELARGEFREAEFKRFAKSGEAIWLRASYNPILGFDGKPRKVFIYNVCDHAACHREVGGQAVSYTTGVPAMVGAMLMLQGTWRQPGVVHMEQLDPAPFLQVLAENGLAWHVLELDPEQPSLLGLDG